MNRMNRLGWGLIFVVLAGLACSEGDPENVTSRPMVSVFTDEMSTANAIGSGVVIDPEDHPPVVTDVTFEPDAPVGGSRLRVLAHVDGVATAIRYQWLLNGVEFGNNAAEVAVPTIEKDDVIRVRMTPLRGVVEGALFEATRVVRNQRPTIRGLEIQPMDGTGGSSGSGERWQAVVHLGDLDVDSVDVEYKWTINGAEQREEGDSISVEGLSRGDALSVSVRVFDGRLWSPTAESGTMQIGNSPPEIVSNPPRPGAGGVFHYAVRATDRDAGDRLKYELRTAPRGMRVSEVEGVVRWTPDVEQSGRHEVEVVVTDTAGGEATQFFVVSLVTNSPDVPAAPR